MVGSPVLGPPRWTLIISIGNSTTGSFALLPNPNPSGNFTKITQRLPVRIAIDGLEPYDPTVVARTLLLGEQTMDYEVRVFTISAIYRFQ